MSERVCITDTLNAHIFKRLASQHGENKTLRNSHKALKYKFILIREENISWVGMKWQKKREKKRNVWFTSKSNPKTKANGRTIFGYIALYFMCHFCEFCLVSLFVVSFVFCYCRCCCCRYSHRFCWIHAAFFHHCAPIIACLTVVRSSLFQARVYSVLVLHTIFFSTLRCYFHL